MNTSLYKIKHSIHSYLDHKWEIYYYDIFEDYFFTKISGERGVCDNIVSHIDFIHSRNYDLPYRFSITESTIQFTCAIFPKSKTVLIGSKQLGYELTLLRWLKDKEEVLSSDLEKIKDHANKIASIPVENTPAPIDFITHRYGLVDFTKPEFEQTLLKAEELTGHLVEKINDYDQSLFEKISDFGLDLTANYKLIRIHLLKFLAILPSLEHDISGNEVKRMFLESLRRLNSDSKKAKAKRLKGQSRGLPKSYLFLIKLIYKICGVIPSKILAKILRYSVAKMAKRFIAGESIELAEASMKQLLSSGRDATLDQLGELVVSKKEADIYEQKVISIIKGMKQHIKPGHRNKAGINKAHISIKVSALTHNFKPYSFESTYQSVSPRLKNILIEAKKHEVFINIDAEHYHYRDIVLSIYAKVLLETPELKSFSDTGIVVQAYLRDGHKHFKDVLALAKQRGLRMPIRLVKGAYWDVETVEATAHNFEAPEFLNKEETDIHFRQLIFLSLEHSEFIQLAIASHNIQDHCFAEALRDTHFSMAPVIEHQTLHMTYEALSYGLNLMNWPSRNYIPVGNLLVGMAYLVRRIMENSSQVGILTIMRSHKKSLNHKAPEVVLREKFLRKEIVYDDSILKLRREFRNIYPLRSYIRDELKSVQTSLLIEQGKINSYEPESGRVPVYSPSDNSTSSNNRTIIGSVEYDTPESIDKKINMLANTFNETKWSSDYEFRHASFLKLADLMLIERNKLASMIILEAGKSLEEALADVDEAIDFIQFYTREYFDISLNSDKYIARGVFGVIAPWNFPLAIPVGMTIAALITGNTAILKAAEQTPLIAAEFLRLALESGIPSSCFSLAQGEGEIGKAIVDHKLIDGVVFTGSVNVGISIYEKIKLKTSRDSSRVAITEMGGKNAIIVTSNCELDETVSGIIYSSFAHAGQKCSAASRIIVAKEVKDSFVERFIEAVADLTVNKSYKLNTDINPLASVEDKKRLIDLNRQAREETESFGGEVLLDLSSGDYPGNCVGPSIYEITAKRSMDATSIAQQEIFGPLVHIIPFEDLDEAIDVFNSTSYALTGGIFCQSQDDIDYLAPKLICGNIYINRPSTGARVAIEPFGGFKLSGTGPKAGSTEYLYKFLKTSYQSSKEKLIFFEDDVKEDIATKTTTSKLIQRKRIDLTLELIDRLANRFEFFFQGINHDRKDTLLNLYNFLSEDSNLHDSREFPNRQIPGQLNYDLRDFKLGRGSFVLCHEKVDFSILLDVLVNIAIGNSVNLICINEGASKSWKHIVDLIYVIGFSSRNIALFNQNKSLLLEHLKDKELDFIVCENRIELIDLISSNVFVEQNMRTSLIKLIVSGEELLWGDWERYLKLYTQPRSFAINTMRHGAPLELDI